MPWSARFDDPIELQGGKKLRTLRDAVKYLAETVPQRDHDHPAVQLAAEVLTAAAEGRDLIWHARGISDGEFYS